MNTPDSLNKDSKNLLNLISKNWNELDDLAHLNGPEIMEENTILEVNDYDSSDKISEIVITNEMLEVEDEPEVSEELIKEVQCVYGQAFNKGRFIYGPIESDKPFDTTKLKMNCSDWDGQIIHLRYQLRY